MRIVKYLVVILCILSIMYTYPVFAETRLIIDDSFDNTVSLDEEDWKCTKTTLIGLDDYDDDKGGKALRLTSDTNGEGRIRRRLTSRTGSKILFDFNFKASPDNDRFQKNFLWITDHSTLNQVGNLYPWLLNLEEEKYMYIMIGRIL